MAKQTINVGSGDQSGDGEGIRSAFVKTNENFDEVYNSIDELYSLTESNNVETTSNIENLSARVDNLDVSDLSDNTGLLGGGGTADVSWADSQNRTFNAVHWSSGKELTITATPFETSNATTYDNRSNSQYIYFVWDQNFIDNVWNGYNTPAGEGQSYSVSLDNGVTWIPTDLSGYNGGLFFYLWIPNDFQENYSFTYTAGQPALIRYNRGSMQEVWFDLADAPVSANEVVGVDLSVVVEATIPGDPDQSARIIMPDFRFMNVLYDDNTGQGYVNDGARIWSGSSYVENRIEIDNRKIDEPADAGRVYATLRYGAVGTMTFYWNAKLYTIS